MRKIVFRADGSTEVGLGHVIRSIALAEMLKDHFYCVFAIQEPSILLKQQIEEVCSEIIILERTNNDQELGTELDPFLRGDEIVVLDGYKFDTFYQRKIKEKGLALVCIDDIHAYHFVADLVINHGSTDASAYSSESYTRKLLGTNYCLLRKPFLQEIEETFIPKEEGSVFLCFGGADATNLTCSYLDILLRMSELKKIHVVVGSAYQHREVLDEFLHERGSKNVQVHCNISAQELVKTIRSCKVAIVPGSTIAIECASLGIPMICGYYVANQHDIAQMLTEIGLANTINDFTNINEWAFAEKVQHLLLVDAFEWYSRSRTFFDGKAKDRFLKAFSDLLQMRSISLRKASVSDVTLFYEWANDPTVRQNAIHKVPIIFENHKQWFSRKLKSENSFIYVATIGGKEFGQVRFDQEEKFFVIDYSISSNMRGKGLAVSMLSMAMQRLQQEAPALPLKALVKTSNFASKKVFESLAFCLKEVKFVDSEEYYVFETPL